MTMLRKYFRKYLPDNARIRSHRMLRPFGSLLRHPNLWHLDRESVAGGVAIGLFAGLMTGPLQMLTAALLAVPLYLLAYEYGKLLLGAGGGPPRAAPPVLDWTQLGASLHALVDWPHHKENRT